VRPLPDLAGASGELRLLAIFLGLLVCVAAGFVLRQLQAVLMPFVLALFLAQVFNPLQTRLRARGVPRALALLFLLAVVAAALLLVGWIASASFQGFSASLPRYAARFNTLFEDLTGRLVATFPALEPQLANLHWGQAVEASSITAMVTAGLGSFFLFFEEMVLVLLFLLFLLLGEGALPRKLERALPPGRADRVAAVVRNIEAQVRKYLLLKTLVNLGVGLAVAVLFAACGVDFPLFWGFLAFLAHYIPNLGAVISVGLPALFLLLQLDSVGRALIITAINAAVQFAVGHFLEPRVMGTSLDLSPVLVLFALIFWGWLWGAWGMVLAVPLTAMLKIVCENVAPLRPVAVLMSGH
jgi:AI-2 transport protein TqsA